MARFELSIYGANDEVLKKYETNHVKWGVLLEAVKLQDEIKDEESEKQFKAINNFVKKIFTGLTDEELEKADSLDVINTFNQLIKSVSNIGGSKNVQRVRLTLHPAQALFLN